MLGLLINTTFEDGAVSGFSMIYNIPVLFPRSRRAAYHFSSGEGRFVAVKSSLNDHWMNGLIRAVQFTGRSQKA
jgi:hypothetical protein